MIKTEQLAKSGRLKDEGKTREIKKNNLIVYLDRSQIFPDDPGNGTPALVMFESGKMRKSFCSTYWAAIGEGELLGSRGEIKRLTSGQIEWLESLNDIVEEFLK